MFTGLDIRADIGHCSDGIRICRIPAGDVVVGRHHQQVGGCTVERDILLRPGLAVNHRAYGRDVGAVPHVVGVGAEGAEHVAVVAVLIDVCFNDLALVGAGEAEDDVSASAAAVMGGRRRADDLGGKIVEVDLNKVHAVVVRKLRVHGGVHGRYRGNGNGAGGLDIGIRYAGSRNGGGAAAHGGHFTGFVHGGNGRVGRGPRDGAVAGGHGQGFRLQLRGVAAVKGQRSGRHGHAGYGVRVDGLGNEVLNVEIYAVARSGARKTVVVSYVIGAVAGAVTQTAVVGSVGKVRVRCRRGGGEGDVVPADGKVITAVAQADAAAVGCRGEHSRGVCFLNGHHAVIAGYGHGGSALGGAGMAQGIARACGVGVHDQVVLAGFQRAGQAVNGALDHDWAVRKRHQLGGLVAGVVGKEHGAGAAHVVRGGIEGVGQLGTCLGLRGYGFNISLAAGYVHHAQVGHILVIAEGQRYGAVIVQHGAADHGGGVIHCYGVADVGALAVVAGGKNVLELRARQGAGLDIAGGFQNIILGEGKVTEGELIAFIHAQGAYRAVRAHAGGGGVLPRGRCKLRIVIRCVLVRGGVGSVEHGAVLFHGGKRCADGGPDQVIAGLVDVGAAVQGKAVRREGGFLYIRVARKGCVGGRAVVADVPQVGVRGVVAGKEIGGLVCAVIVLLITHGVKHGGVRPGAVEADHRDGVGDVVFGVQAGIRFNISSACAFRVQGCFLGFGQRDGYGHGAHAARGHDLGLYAGLSGTEPREQRVSIAAGDAIGAVQFGSCQIVMGAIVRAGNVGKYRIGVRLVRIAVLIHVGRECDRLGIVPRVAHVYRKRRGGVFHQGLIGTERLREDVGAERVFHVFIAEVVDLEGIGVNAVAGGIVAQLRFYLVIVRGDSGIGAHLDVALGVHGAFQIGKASALLQEGVIMAGCRFLHRHGGGHQLADGEVPRGKAGFIGNAVIVVELAHCGGKTRDLRGRHGGTAHQLVLIVTAFKHVSLVLTLMVAVQGEHAAAGGRDLGLQGQRAGNAPGTELAHLIVIARYGLVLAVDLNGAGVVIDVIGGLARVGGLDLAAHVQLDARYRRGVGVAVHGGAAHAAGLVVYHDQGHGAGLHSGVGLHIEIGSAAVAHRYLARYQALQRVELVGAGAVGLAVARVTGAVQINEIIGAGNVDQVGLGAARHIVIIRGDIAEVEEGDGGAAVIHGGHGKGIHKGAGAAAGHQVDVIGVKLLLVVPRIVIAHGNAQRKLRILQVVHDGLIGGGGVGNARQRGTQRKVRAGGAQTDRVFHGGKVIGIVSTAAGAEHLHNEELRIGRFAHHANGFGCIHKGIAALQVAVGRRNAAYVGAVLALLVAYVVHGGVVIHVVVGEGQLGGEVNAVSAVQGGFDGIHLGLRQQIVGGTVGGFRLFNGVIERLGVHGLVIGIETGIDHGQPRARARILGGVAEVGTHHIARVAHHGIIGVGRCNRAGGVLLFYFNAFHAVHGGDLRNVAVAHVGGNGVGEQRKVPFHFHGPAGGGFNFCLHGVLAPAQRFLVRKRAGIGADALYGVTRVTGRGLVQKDGNTNRIVQPVGQCFGRSLFFRVRFAQLWNIQRSGIDGSYGELLAAGFCAGRRNRGNDHGKQHNERNKNRKQFFGL